MLQPTQIFGIANSVAMLCWLALAVSLFASPLRTWTWRITGYGVPLAFACVYVVLIHRGMQEAPDGGFGSIAAVRALFTSDAALTAGWLHYLAFDLFVGTWIARTGGADKIHPLLLLLYLPLTFMLGPAGLLTFAIVRRRWPGPAVTVPAA